MSVTKPAPGPWLACLILLFASTACATDQVAQKGDTTGLECSASEVGTGLTSELQVVQSANPFPGGALAIHWPARFERPIARSVGVSDIRSGTTLTGGEVFLAGSVGKTFFAALALQLASEGELDLDSEIGRHLSDADLPSDDQVTVRMLLNHTSGYPEYDVEFMEDLIGDPTRVREPSDWFDVVRRSPPAAEAIGSYRYSDVNFVLLAAVLDEVSPSSAYEAIEKRLLEPLGLSSTMPSNTREIPGLVQGHEGDPGLFGSDRVLIDGRLIYNPQFEWGGGGFASNVSDLARWIAAFGQAEVFSPGILAEAIARPPSVPDSVSSWYGLGIHVDDTRLGRALGHSGYIPGYLSWVRWYEAHGLAVAMQVNASDNERVREDGFDWLDRVAAQLVSSCGDR